MGPTHVCSKPEFLPAQSDLDGGNPSFKHRAKLMCLLLLKGLCFSHCVEAQAACTCCLASALPPPLPSPALRSLCSPPGQCSVPGICWPALAAWCEVFSFLPLLILLIPSISKQNHNIPRLLAHSSVGPLFCGLGCLLVDNEREDDPSCISHPSRKACQAS